MEYKAYNDQMKDLGARVLHEGTRVWERYFQVLGEVSTGKWSPEDTRKRFVRFTQAEGPEFFRKVMQCHVDYYVNLMNAGLDLSNSMVESVFSPMGETPADPGQSTSGGSTKEETQTEIPFEGRIGETHSQAFVIANKQAKKIEVGFELSEFVSEDGKTKMRVPVAFNPHRFALEPGQEQVVECQLTFEKSLRPGQRYSALARVVGFPDMMVRFMATPKES